MNLPYSVRLLCLSLASFFLVNLIAGLVVSSLANAAGRFARRMGAVEGARFLLVLRFVPMVLGACVVGGVCVPSYLWMEPATIDEPVGWLCLLVAAVAVFAWVDGAVRAVRAVVRSGRYLRLHPVPSRRINVDGQSFLVSVTDRNEPLFALAGIVQPRLLIATRAFEAFPVEELACALRHEQAHAYSRDNFKRLIMLLAPDVLPFFRILRPLERTWAGLAEWAADDRASAGSPQRSVAMAAALVRAARLTTTPVAAPNLITALLADGEDLTLRVDRLLRNADVPAKFPLSPAFGIATLVIAICAVAVMLHPATPLVTHGLLERLVH